MEWISAGEFPPTEKKILVFCKKCKNIHSVHLDYDEYCLAEACYEGGHFFTGGNVDFDWYMPLPKPPEVVSEETKPCKEEEITTTIKVDELNERVELLENQLRSLTHIILFHKLNEIPSKYKKAFPSKGEYPFFTGKQDGCDPYYDYTKSADSYWHTARNIDAHIPSQQEMEKCKERMKSYAKTFGDDKEKRDRMSKEAMELWEDKSQDAKLKS